MDRKYQLRRPIPITTGHIDGLKGCPLGNRNCWKEGGWDDSEWPDLSQMRLKTASILSPLSPRSEDSNNNVDSIGSRSTVPFTKADGSENSEQGQTFIGNALSPDSGINSDVDTTMSQLWNLSLQEFVNNEAEKEKGTTGNTEPDKYASLTPSQVTSRYLHLFRKKKDTGDDETTDLLFGSSIWSNNIPSPPINIARVPPGFSVTDKSRNNHAGVDLTNSSKMIPVELEKELEEQRASTVVEVTKNQLAEQVNNRSDEPTNASFAKSPTKNVIENTFESPRFEDANMLHHHQQQQMFQYPNTEGIGVPIQTWNGGDIGIQIGTPTAQLHSLQNEQQLEIQQLAQGTNMFWGESFMLPLPVTPLPVFVIPAPIQPVPPPPIYFHEMMPSYALPTSFVEHFQPVMSPLIPRAQRLQRPHQNVLNRIPFNSAPSKYSSVTPLPPRYKRQQKQRQLLRPPSCHWTPVQQQPRVSPAPVLKIETEAPSKLSKAPLNDVMMPKNQKLRDDMIQHSYHPPSDDYYNLMREAKRATSPNDVAFLEKLYPRQQRDLVQTKPYQPIEFENCLGKLRIVSMSSPRQLIDDVIRVEYCKEKSPNKNVNVKRCLLLEIEELYECLLILEEYEIRANKLGNSDAKLRKQMNKSLDKITKAFSNSNGEKILSIVSVSKGKMLIMRVLPLIPSSLRYKTLGQLLNIFSIWGVEKPDIPEIFSYLKDCIIRAELKDLFTVITSVENYTTFELMFTSTLGITIMSCIFHQAENLLKRSDPLLAGAFANMWTRRASTVVAALCIKSKELASPIEQFSDVVENLKRSDFDLMKNDMEQLKVALMIGWSKVEDLPPDKLFS